MKQDQVAIANIANIAKAVMPLVNDITLRRATVYVKGGTIKATRQRRVDRRSRQETFLLTFGSPNYAEREALKRAKKQGVVLDRVLQVWPAKRVKPAKAKK